MRCRVEVGAGHSRGEDKHSHDQGAGHQEAHRDVRLHLAPHCRGDGDRGGGDEGHGQCRVARGCRARVPADGQSREQSAERDRCRREVAKPCLVEQVKRPGAEVCGDKERADQVPGPVQGLVPAERRTEELGARRYAVKEQADRPDELEAVATLKPLVEHHAREHESEQGRGQRKDDVHPGISVEVTRRRPFRLAPAA